MFPHQNSTESCLVCQTPNHLNNDCYNCLLQQYYQPEFELKNFQSSDQEIDLINNNQLNNEQYYSTTEINHFQVQQHFNDQSLINNQNLNGFNSNSIEEDWTKIDKEFAEKNLLNEKTYQQVWEEEGLTYQDAHRLIIFGFTVYNYDEAKKWKENNFTFQQIKEWILFGLRKEDYDFAVYLRDNNYHPGNVFQIKSLVQHWLDWQYPLNQRNEIIELEISNKNLIGSLDLSDFINLEKLNCSHNQINELILKDNINLKDIYCYNNQLTILDLIKQTNLENLMCYNNQITFLIVDNCIKLEILFCEQNKLTELILPSNNQLKKINFSHNQLTNFPYQSLNPITLTELRIYNNIILSTDIIVFKDLINLERLDISNSLYYIEKNDKYNRFFGSLESLKNLNKLEKFDISNTDIDQGFLLMAERFAENMDNFGFSHNDNFPQFKIKDLVKNSMILSLPTSEKINIFINNQKKNKFKWINFSNFFAIKQIAEGGHGSVSSSIYIESFEILRVGKKVALKFLKKKINENQEEYEEKVLKEITNHHLFDDNKIIECIGLSQNLSTQEYVLVMEYVSQGDLRNYLKNSENKLPLGDRLKKLIEIATGLMEVHNKGLVHKDFHSGNILKSFNWCYITDLGQCEIESEQQGNNEKFLGVLPYVAPEVLQGGKYTFASDIYSFGIIMIEMINQLPPHCYEDWSDKNLRKRIVEGFRPEIHFNIPQLFKNLINKCLDNYPSNRPTAQQIKETIEGWLNSNKIKKNTEFYQQYKSFEKLNSKIKLSTFKKEFHPSTHYHSKWIPTVVQEIFKDNNMEMEIDEFEPLSSRIKRNLSISQEETVKQDNEKKTKVDYRQEYQKLIRLVNSLLGKEKTSSIEQEILKRTQPISADIELGIDYKQSILSLKSEFNSLFSNKQAEIDYLEKRVEELSNLIRQRKEKIVNIFSRLIPDKKEEIDLIQKLVIAHLDYTRAKEAKKQNLTSISPVPLRRKRDDIRNDLEELLGDSLVDEIEFSLNECEDLIVWELELEAKLKNKNHLIEKHKQSPILQITASESRNKIIELEEQTQQTQLLAFEQLKEQMQNLSLEKAKLEGKLESKNEEIAHFRGKNTYQTIISQSIVDCQEIEIKENFNPTKITDKISKLKTKELIQSEIIEIKEL